MRLSSDRTLAVQIAAGRTAIGTTVLAAPVPAARLLGADTATARRVIAITRMLAVRDAALGVGALAALSRGRGADWLLAGAVSDAVDAAVLASTRGTGTDRGARRFVLAAGAGTAAAAGFLVGARIGRLSVGRLRRRGAAGRG